MPKSHKDSAEQKFRAKQGNRKGICVGDPALEEFLRVMQPRNKASIWANDDAVPEAAKPGAVARKRRKISDAAAAGMGSDGEGEGDPDEEFQDLPDVKAKASRKRKAAVADEGEAPPIFYTFALNTLEAAVADVGEACLDPKP